MPQFPDSYEMLLYKMHMKFAGNRRHDDNQCSCSKELGIGNSTNQKRVHIILPQISVISKTIT